MCNFVLEVWNICPDGICSVVLLLCMLCCFIVVWLVFLHLVYEVCFHTHLLCSSLVSRIVSPSEHITLPRPVSGPWRDYALKGHCWTAPSGSRGSWRSHVPGWKPDAFPVGLLAELLALPSLTAWAPVFPPSRGEWKPPPYIWKGYPSSCLPFPSRLLRKPHCRILLIWQMRFFQIGCV